MENRKNNVNGGIESHDSVAATHIFMYYITYVNVGIKTFWIINRHMRAGWLTSLPEMTDWHIRIALLKYTLISVQYSICETKYTFQCIIYFLIIQCITEETSSSLHMCHGSERIQTRYAIRCVYWTTVTNTRSHNPYKHAKLSISDIQTIHEEQRWYISLLLFCAVAVTHHTEYQLNHSLYSDCFAWISCRCQIQFVRNIWSVVCWKEQNVLFWFQVF